MVFGAGTGCVAQPFTFRAQQIQPSQQHAALRDAAHSVRFSEHDESARVWSLRADRLHNDHGDGVCLTNPLSLIEPSAASTCRAALHHGPPLLLRGTSARGGEPVAPRRASDSEATISAVSDTHEVKRETDYSFGTNVEALVLVRRLVAGESF